MSVSGGWAALRSAPLPGGRCRLPAEYRPDSGGGAAVGGALPTPRVLGVCRAQVGRWPALRAGAPLKRRNPEIALQLEIALQAGSI